MRIGRWTLYLLLASTVFGLTATCAGRAMEGPPTVVFQLDGSGTETTASFKVNIDWSLSYQFDCTKAMRAIGGFGNFAVNEDEVRAVLVNRLDPSGSATVYRHSDSGVHYLTVISECPWSVTVTNNDRG
jgi:hypothetical protein